MPDDVRRKGRMDWANLGLPCLLVRPLTNLQFKEGLRIPRILRAKVSWTEFLEGKNTSTKPEVPKLSFLIPVVILYSPGTRFPFWLQDYLCLELNAKSASETELPQNSIPIPRPNKVLNWEFWCLLS